MTYIKKLIKNNIIWSKNITTKNPNYFRKLSVRQKPKILWIGCSDSRVIPEQLLGIEAGEILVHRNIANLIIYDDFNCFSVIEYATKVLKIKEIIVCGHYQCGGVQAALECPDLSITSKWISCIHNTKIKHNTMLKKMRKENAFDALCEINLIEQVVKLCSSNMIQLIWQKKKKLTIHGWIYDIKKGLIKDLNLSIENNDHFKKFYDKFLINLEN